MNHLSLEISCVQALARPLYDGKVQSLPLAHISPMQVSERWARVSEILGYLAPLASMIGGVGARYGGMSTTTLVDFYC